MARQGTNNQAGGNAGGHENYGASDDQMHEARRLQELLHGRFSEEEALKLLEHHKICQKFFSRNKIIFTDHGTDDPHLKKVQIGEPQQVRQVSGQGDGWRSIPTDPEVQTLAYQNDVPYQIRQFSCEPCDSVWWRKAPSRKMVSKCKRCRTRYLAIPREREWGWAKFQCTYCGRIFHGFGQMNSTTSQCYDCGNWCPVVEVIPPRFRQRRGRARHVHSCSAHNCYNRSPDAEFRPNRCVHPRSLERQVVTASLRHNSTGSTVATFLSQGGLMNSWDYPGPRNMRDIPEDEE